MSIILASASPRRAQLLHQIGVEFSVMPSDIDESVLARESVIEYVTRMASHKAHVAQEACNLQDIIIAADTTVSINEKILGKPVDQTDHLNMFASLSGSVHTVHTAVVVSQGEFVGNALSTSEVTFRDITTEEAKNYWITGEPKDKAGGYAIQGLGAVFVECLVGSYTGVVGLPIFELTQLLKQVGVYAIPGQESKVSQ